MVPGARGPDPGADRVAARPPGRTAREIRRRGVPLTGGRGAKVVTGIDEDPVFAVLGRKTLWLGDGGRWR